MTDGPYLYDDGPAPLHTGTPRRRRGLLLAVLGGTVAVAIGMAVSLPLVKGSPQEQAREVTSVFFDALEQRDLQTAQALLCDDERSRLRPEQVAAEYVQPGAAEVTGTTPDQVGDTAVQRVHLRWSGGGNSTLTVVSEDGPRVCGTAAGG